MRNWQATALLLGSFAKLHLVLAAVEVTVRPPPPRGRQWRAVAMTRLLRGEAEQRVSSTGESGIFTSREAAWEQAKKELSQFWMSSCFFGEATLAGGACRRGAARAGGGGLSPTRGSPMARSVKKTTLIPK